MSTAIYVCCRPANLTGSDHEMGRIKQARSSYTAETMASHLQWVPCRRYLTAFLYIPCPLHMHTIHTYGERQRVIKASLDSCYSRSKRPSLPLHPFPIHQQQKLGPPTNHRNVVSNDSPNTKHAENLFSSKEKHIYRDEGDSSLIDFDTFPLRHPFFYFPFSFFYISNPGVWKKEKFRSCSLLELVGCNKFRVGG